MRARNENYRRSAISPTAVAVAAGVLLTAQPMREEFPAGVYRFRTEVCGLLRRTSRFAVTSVSFGIE